jgi:Hypothetical glycosyl hydrolase family 15
MAGEAEEGGMDRRWGARGPLAIALVVAVAAVAVIGGLVFLRSDEKPTASEPAPAAGWQDHPPDRRPVEAFGTAKSERRFIRVGASGGRQFTDAELRYLADNFNYVLLTKYHGGYDIRLHHEAARRLKELNPSVRVFPYFSTKYWYEANEWGVELDPAFLLKDNSGEVVGKRRGGEELDAGEYVDLANPAYRQWALGVLSSWLEAAPYDGISFDSADLIGDYPAKEARRWQEDLGPERIEQWNEGLRALLRDARAMAGPDREVLYNGIAPGPLRGPSRGLELLDLTDGALDERFCLNADGEYNDLRADLKLMADTDAMLFMRATGRSQGPERSRLARYCLGAFLLGWEPGRSYFQFGDDYTAAQLADDPPVQRVELGRPSGEARIEGPVGERRFERGMAFVNLGDEAVEVRSPEDFVTWSENGTGARVTKGQVLKVEPRDTVLLLVPQPAAG